MSSEPLSALSLDECVGQALDRYGVPGMAVAVLQDGHVDARGYGITSLETRQPVTAATLFQVGSISKIFTATLVMRLVEDGLLDLDAPVAAYLPDLRLALEDAPAKITLRHLLSHASGIEGDRFEDIYGQGDDALARAVSEFHTLDLLTSPGELWAYSNNGFNLAGFVIEAVTGETFENVMRRLVLQPLGMDRSFYFAHEAITYPVAVGHQHEPDTEPKIARNYPLPRYCAPAGGIISTVEDLLRFAALHLGGELQASQIISSASINAMQSPAIRSANFAAAYGLGWAIPRDDVRLISHGGSTNGFQALLALAPDRQFAIAVLTNSGRGHAAQRDIQEWALAHYLSIMPLEPKVVEAPAEVIARFAGRYRSRYNTIEVAPADHGLRFEVTAFNPLTNETTTYPAEIAQPISEREFIFTEGDARTMRIDFINDSSGAPHFLRAGGRLAVRVD